MDKSDLIQYVAERFWKYNHRIDPVPESLETHIEWYYYEYISGEIYPGDEVIRNLANEIYDKVIKKLKKIQIKYKKQLNEKKIAEASLRFHKAENEIYQKARTHQNKASFNQIKYLKSMNGLNDDEISQLYSFYVEEWERIHSNENVSKNKTKEKSFKERVDDFVLTHNDELLSPEEFQKVISSWNRNMSNTQAYEYYKNKFFEIPGITVNINEPKDLSKLGFRNKDKYKFGSRNYEMNPKIDEKPSNSFPLKSNIKLYQTHKVAPRGTYIIDFMFDKNLVFLVAINVNTRYAMIEMTNLENGDEIMKKDGKTATSYLRALNKMIKEVSKTNPIRYLTGDGEKAFVSKKAIEVYKSFNIKFKAVPREQILGKKTSDPLHSSLGILDRFVRTIRDMLYNAGYDMTPLALKEMIRQYNNAPHRTLSKYIGFDVSPKMIQEDKNKEEYIVMKINKENIDIRLSNGFELFKDAQVKVYNDKDVLGKRRTIYQPGDNVIVGRKGVLFEIKNKSTGKTQILPRYKLSLQ